MSSTNTCARAWLNFHPLSEMTFGHSWAFPKNRDPMLKTHDKWRGTRVSELDFGEPLVFLFVLKQSKNPFVQTISTPAACFVWSRKIPLPLERVYKQTINLVEIFFLRARALLRKRTIRPRPKNTQFFLCLLGELCECAFHVRRELGGGFLADDDATPCFTIGDPART